MATPKTITTYDVEQGKLTILKRGSDIHFERRYKFLDISDMVIEELAGGRLINDIAIASLPTSITDALSTIDTWLYNQILAQEGMD